MIPESEISVDTPIERSIGRESRFSIAAAYLISSCLHEPRNMDDNITADRIYGNTRRVEINVSEEPILIL